MAMNRRPASFSPTICLTRSKKYCLKMFGSSVAPDLLETMKIVVFRSILFSNAHLSRIRRVQHVELGKPADRAECHPQHFRTQARTAHAEQQRMGEAARSLFRLMRVNRSICASWPLVMPSHPSQFPSSAPVHSEASRAQSRRTLSWRASRRARLSAPQPAFSGSVYVWRLILPAPASCFACPPP